MPQPLQPFDGPTETGSTEIKATSADAPVEGWVLHEVYDGVALIEGRNRRLLEVDPARWCPASGASKRSSGGGRRWVVVTAKGVISPVR